ncbi:hypothetical protein DNTS_034816 [Danionella cerebrum]|uniref:Uncharacterized protein n=1 Tax=Danionella cerebrum TaxID=2873325 RepID=A0A553RA18_9TELE|nr:hypothetical protein DNTS_034816 [Danionella translucida]
MTQVKDLLLNDHSAVLPDYARHRTTILITINCLLGIKQIHPLSEALHLIYKEFNSLKERLAELTTKFEGIEHFVDEAQSDKCLWTRGLNISESEGRSGHRNWVMVRRFKKPFNV